MAGNYDWMIPIVTAIAGGVAAKQEAKQANKPTTITQKEERTPYMSTTLNPQLEAIAQLLANNYARHMSKRYPGGGGLTIDPATIRGLFGGGSNPYESLFGGGGGGGMSGGGGSSVMLPKVVRGRA